MDILGNIAEQKIQEAMRKGAFDNLSGQGKPLEIEDLSDINPESRMAFKILKNAGCVPPEVELKKEINELERKISESSSEDEKNSLRVELVNKTSMYNVMVEKLIRK
jgi:hypothetical protein